jgi:hypothetical protein
MGLALKLLPSWGWFLIFGLCLVAAVTGLADYCLGERAYERAVWSTVQLLGAFFVLIVAGFVASNRLRAMHQQLTLSDMLFPDRLWVLAIKNLPATRWQVCTGAWSFMAMLCAVFWTGGLTYWLPTKAKAKPVNNPIVKPVKEENPSEDEPKKDGLAEKTDKDKSEKPENVPEKKTVTKCVIVGYTSANGELTGLVVARTDGNQLRYAGIVPPSKDPMVTRDLIKRFGALKDNAPLFPDLDVQATWLKPRLTCEVESTGVDEDELFKTPEFKGLVFPKKPEPVRVPDGEKKDTKDARDVKKDAKDAGKPVGPDAK